MTNDILNELKLIQAQEVASREKDVIQRTLAKLIMIEKEAMYGSVTSNKSARIEKLLETEFKSYKESLNATSSD